MHRMRAAILNFPRFALIVLALAFAVRAVTPPGFMVAADTSSVLTIAVCSEASGVHKTVQIVLPAKPGERGHGSAEGAKDGHCAFSAMGKSLFGGADPLLLALAFGFILVLGLAPSRVLPARPVPHALPPQRGPPALA